MLQTWGELQVQALGFVTWGMFLPSLSLTSNFTKECETTHIALVHEGSHKHRNQRWCVTGAVPHAHSKSVFSPASPLGFSWTIQFIIQMCMLSKLPGDLLGYISAIGEG